MKKERIRNIVYWVATVWLALGMASTGLVQLMQREEEVALIVDQLGYPLYFLNILAIWKLLGVIAVLAPRFPLVKEWAYVGFFFAMTGAVLSHLAVGAPTEIFPALLLLLLTTVSWYFRPPSRRLAAANTWA